MPGSTLIDKFEQFELTTNLKQMSPREARLGRWVLLYGILQTLSTLSVDVQGLKYSDGVRYFLNTDLKRLPEWVANGQTEHLEAKQQHSWCWQRTWDPKPLPSIPVELEAPLGNGRTMRYNSFRDAEAAGHTFLSPPPQHALPPPPPSLDGVTLMQNEIQRLGEKIDNFSLSHNARPNTNQGNESETPDGLHDRKPRLQGETFGPQAARNSQRDKTTTNNNMTLNTNTGSLGRHREPASSTPRSQSRMEDMSRLTGPGFDNASSISFLDRQQHALLQHPPNVSMQRHHHHNNISLDTDLGSYPFSSNEMQWPVPPGYAESNANARVRDSTVLGIGDDREDGMGVRIGQRRPHDRGGWDR